MKTQIKTSEAPGAPAFLSQAIESNGFIFVSGQIHTTTEGRLIEGSAKEKLDQVIKNISAILKSADCELSNVVKVTMYVTEISELPEINKIYPSYFSEPFPAREAICVKALPLGASIEISVIAMK